MDDKYRYRVYFCKPESTDVSFRERHTLEEIEKEKALLQKRGYKIVAVADRQNVTENITNETGGHQ